jgi:ABC-type branched-subunit amino acid transport system substrate-binding protein
MRKLFGAIALLGALVAVQVGPAQAGNSQGRNQHSKLVTTDGQVVVRRGEPVQLAAVLDTSTGAGAAYTQSIHNAIEMAVQLSPAIRGFRIELNDDFDGPCGDGPGVVGQNADAASSVVANAQNVAVIGHMCSYGFGAATSDGCPSAAPTTALSIYESHGVVTVNGSTTNPCLPSVGPTVFNATAVPGAEFDAWYATVKSLPSDQLWAQLYQLEFGTAPTDFADLYFDATRVLLARIQKVSRIAGGKLVINRAALASAVRNTAGFPGVTCTVTLDSGGYRVNDPAALARCAGS